MLNTSSPINTTKNDKAKPTSHINSPESASQGENEQDPPVATQPMEVRPAFNSESNKIIKYVGELNEEGKPHGEGFIEYSDGSTYKGEFSDGRINGRGVINFLHGNKFEGYLKDDKRHGQGIFTWADGERYEGNFENDMRSGQGAYYYANGEMYVGEFYCGQKHGEGKFFYKNRSNKSNKVDTYTGKFKNGVREGDGKLEFANGNKYEGEFKNDKRDGRGVFTWSSGNKYEGEFKNDKRTGHGIYYWSSSGKYVGDFENDRRSGVGTYYYPDGSVYEGHFKDGVFEGIGCYYNKNGWAWEGEFANYKRDGSGLSVSPDAKRKFRELWDNGRLMDRDEINDDNAQTIYSNWKLIRKIGSGSYGDIYLCEDRKSSERKAIKLEKSDRKKLRMEIELLTSMRTSSKVPNYVAHGHNCNYDFLVMDLLGTNLNDLRKSQPRGKFSITTACKLGIQMIQGIQAVHEHGYVHRDIKPSNFVMGQKGTPNECNVYIIDFGLAKRYKSADTGAIIPPRKKAGWNGTQRYASINTHKRRELGPHDDIWSLFYVLVQFIKGHLPWCDTRGKDEIGRVKVQYNNPKLTREMPPQFLQIMNYLHKIDYYDTPDYKYIIGLLEAVQKVDQQQRKLGKLAPDTPADLKIN